MSRLVLVVEDDDHIRELVRTCLELVGGYTVDTASSGLAALDVLDQQEELPDAVLLDVMMPGLDGVSLVRRLRQCESTRNLPVVLLTAKSSQAELELSGLGISGTIAKPFNPMTLPDEFSALLGWPERSSS